MASNHSKPVVRWASAALALVGATALALTVCSTTTGGGDTPTDGGTAAPQSVIKLGEIGDFTSQAGTAYPGIPRVIQLAIDDLNANGGINGAEVELVTCDLQYLPDQASRCARQMVEAGVSAVLVQSLVGAEKIPPIFESAHIPYFPAYALSVADMQSPASFPFVPGIMLQIGAGYLSATECKKPVLVTIQAPTNDFTKQLVGIGAEAGGGKMPDVVLAPTGTTDWAPIAEQVVANNPDCVMAFMSESLNSVFDPALKQTGWKDRSPGNKLIGYQGGVYTQKILDSFPDLTDGLVAVDYSLPYSDPKWAKFNGYIESLSGGNLANLTSSYTKGSYLNFIGWTNTAKLVADSGQPVDNDTIWAELEGGATIDMNGFTDPFSTKNSGDYPDWPRLFNTKLVIEEVHGGKVETRNNGEFVDLGPDVESVVK